MQHLSCWSSPHVDDSLMFKHFSIDTWLHILLMLFALLSCASAGQFCYVPSNVLLVMRVHSSAMLQLSNSTTVAVHRENPTITKSRPLPTWALLTSSRALASWCLLLVLPRIFYKPFLAPHLGSIVLRFKNGAVTRSLPPVLLVSNMSQLL